MGYCDEMYRHYQKMDRDRKKNNYWSNICRLQERQTEKGLSKYGQILEENIDMNIIERLEYLEEELIDGLMYIEHIKAHFADMDDDLK